MCLGCIEVASKRCRELSGEVSTGSSSDRVVVLANSIVVWIKTRSLLLPVLTASSPEAANCLTQREPN
jgi:hypothetical protein